MKIRIVGYVALMMVVALLSILTTSCQSSQSLDLLAPYQPEIGNKPDSFQFQVTGVRNVTTTVEYSWQNSATMATVNQSSAVSGGSATVLLYDADKIQRYTKNLGDNGTFRSEAGKTGAWKIQVVLNNFSGTLNFRVQKQ